MTGEFLEALNDCPCLVELHLLTAGPLSSLLSTDEARTRPQGILLNHLQQIHFREITRIDNPGDLLFHLKFPKSTFVILQPEEPFAIRLFKSMFTPPLLPPCVSHARSIWIRRGETASRVIVHERPTPCLPRQFVFHQQVMPVGAPVPMTSLL